MNVRRTRRLLWLTTAALTGGAAAIVALGLTASYNLHDAAPPSSSRAPANVAQNRAKPPGPPPLAAFEPLWRLDLRRPLYDPPPPVVIKPKPKPPPPLTVRLVGTIVDDAVAQAMFVTGRGQIEVRQTGQTIDDATVLTIEPDAVTVMHHGKEQRLTLEQNDR